MNDNTANKYAAVTAAIVDNLGRGIAPWVRPWTTTGASDLPTNVVSEKHYNGGNVLALWIAQTAFGYPTAEWLTFKQARDLGGSVRKGEHASPVFYASSFETKNRDKDGSPVRASFLKAYSVFNVAQCDGLPLRAVPDPRPELKRLGDVDDYLAAIGATVKHGGDRACYSPSLDVIALPERNAFNEPARYYAVALHEHGHWTGAQHRLARTFGKRFGDNAYAFEELVAELTAAFLCAELAIPGELQHPEYIDHWLGILKADAQAVWTAAARATEAVAFLNRAAGRAVENAPEEVAA